MKKMIGFGLMVCALNSHASGWTSTDGHQVGDVYTYGAKDTLSVFLKGRNCENSKNYYFISPSYVSNADQLISMVLAAQMAGKNVVFNYSLDPDGSHCFVKGIKIKN